MNLSTPKSLCFDLLIGGEYIPQLEKNYKDKKHVQIPDILDRTTAEALYSELTASSLWVRRLRDGKAAREISAQQLTALDPRHLKGIEGLVHAGPKDGFRYLYDGIDIPKNSFARMARDLLIDRLVEVLNFAHNLNKVRQIVGNHNIQYFVADASRYLPGHFLNQHDDSPTLEIGEEKVFRIAAAIIHLSPMWSEEWGGILQFHNSISVITGTLVPHYNTLHIFEVPQLHSVSLVAPVAPIPRYAIAGWLCAPGS